MKYHCHPPSQPPSQPPSHPRTFVNYQPPYPISLYIYQMHMVVFHAKVLALSFLIHCSVRQQLQSDNNVTWKLLVQGRKLPMQGRPPTPVHYIKEPYANLEIVTISCNPLEYSIYTCHMLLFKGTSLYRFNS